jgi:presenilin-like A22 family membrane protease
MRLIANMLLLFVCAQMFGIFVGSVIIKDMNSNPYVAGLVVTTNVNDVGNALFFIVYILLGATVMILLIRHLKHLGLLFRLMEFVLISTSSSIVFYAFFRLALGFGESMLLGIIFALAFSASRFFIPSFKNLAAMFATAGVGTIFGISMGLLPLLIFIVLLSIYDFLSVFMTRHMVEMAEFIVKKDMAFTITARAPPPKPGEREQRIDLGTGDMIAPIMMEVSAMMFNPMATVFIFVGAVVSMAAFLTLVWKKKMVLPALPPIVLGMIVGLLTGFLLGFY